jgi:hypothetical protein
MVFAFGALGVVVSAGPEGVLDRLGGKLMKSLAKELGTEVALDASGTSGLVIDNLRPMWLPAAASTPPLDSFGIMIGRREYSWEKVTVESWRS